MTFHGINRSGAELYAQLSDYTRENVSGWVWENVMPHLSGDNRITRPELAQQIRDFLKAYESNFDFLK